MIKQNSRWWIYQERDWIKNMLTIHKNTVNKFELKLVEYDEKIKKFERFLISGE